MADDDNEEQEPEEGEGEGEGELEQETPKGSLKVMGGVIGLVVAGVMLAIIAKPSKAVNRSFLGPAKHSFFPERGIVGNPFDGNFTRLVKFTPSCDFFAYDLAYPDSRRLDEHYETLLAETMQLTISKFRMDEIMAGATREMFSAALEEIADPILFPVHIGMTASPYDTDGASGLRIGDSQERQGTFRGSFYDHVLRVSRPRKTIQLDANPKVSFQGDEQDLLVATDDGSKLFVDVSHLSMGFAGEVNVGVMGRIRRVLTGDIIAQ